MQPPYPSKQPMGYESSPVPSYSSEKSPYQPYRPSQSSSLSSQARPTGPPSYMQSVSGTHNPSYMHDLSVSPMTARQYTTVKDVEYQETSRDQNIRLVVALVCIFMIIAVFALIIGVSYYMHTPAYRFGKYDRTRIQGGERT